MGVVKEWTLDWCDWEVASDDGKDLRSRLTSMDPSKNEQE